MSEDSDLGFEQVFDIVLDKYYDCFLKTQHRFDGVISDETTVQSATATVWINATKERSTVERLTKALKDKIDRTNSEAIPSAVNVWKWHFDSFIKEFGGRITSAIAYYVSQNCSPEDMERNIKERYYHLKCEKIESEEERERIAKELFGDE